MFHTFYYINLSKETQLNNILKKMEYVKNIFVATPASLLARPDRPGRLLDESS